MDFKNKEQKTAEKEAVKPQIELNKKAKKKKDYKKNQDFYENVIKKIEQF